MSERDELRVRDLFAVYRAIDAIVDADESGASRAIAARYIPEYDDKATVGWTQAVEPLFDPGAETLPVDGVRPGRPDEAAALETLVDSLVRITEAQPRGRMKIKLLLGLATLGRLPTFQANDDGDLLRRAFGSLQPRSAVEDLGVEFGALADLALDDDLFPSLRAWDAFAGQAQGAHLLSADVSGQIPQCSDSVSTERIEGELQPVTRLWTQATAALTDAQLAAFVDPMTWPSCNSLYCNPGMIDGQLQADGIHHLYTEVLSTDCANNPKIIVGLLFTSDHDVDSYSLSYEIAPPPNAGNGFVEFDCGDIYAERKGDRWTITSSKYLRFKGVLDGTPLALTACILGYGNYALDFIAKVAEDAVDGETVRDPTGGDPAGPDPVDPPAPQPVDGEIADWDPNFDPTDDGQPDPDENDEPPGWDEPPTEPA